MQSWPLLAKPAILIPGITRSMSASSKMMTGALPPSSRWTLLSDAEAAFATSLPVATSPVSETMLTRGWRTRPAPTGSPCPVITLKTPGGKRSCTSSASRSVVSGVCSEGFSTTVLPAASAGPIFQIAIISG